MIPLVAQLLFFYCLQQNDPLVPYNPQHLLLGENNEGDDSDDHYDSSDDEEQDPSEIFKEDHPPFYPLPHGSMNPDLICPPPVNAPMPRCSDFNAPQCSNPIQHVESYPLLKYLKHHIPCPAPETSHWKAPFLTYLLTEYTWTPFRKACLEELLRRSQLSPLYFPTSARPTICVFHARSNFNALLPPIVHEWDKICCIPNQLNYYRSIINNRHPLPTFTYRDQDIWQQLNF